MLPHCFSVAALFEALRTEFAERPTVPAAAPLARAARPAAKPLRAVATPAAATGSTMLATSVNVCDVRAAWSDRGSVVINPETTFLVWKWKSEPNT